MVLQLNLCIYYFLKLLLTSLGLLFVIRYEVEHCSVIWAIKDEHISTTFFDEAAARFFLDRIQMVKEQEKLNEKRQKYETVNIQQTNSSQICGGALGPDWAANRSMKGVLSVRTRCLCHFFF